MTDETRSNPITLERWRHCKGTFYEIIGIGRHTETQEEVVLYRSLEGTRCENPIWVRPLLMFMDRHSSGAWRFERVGSVTQGVRDTLVSTSKLLEEAGLPIKRDRERFARMAEGQGVD